MSLRSDTSELILSALRAFAPEAVKSDLNFFGSRSFVSSAVPLKFGLDNSEDIVYNIVNKVTVGGAPLFSDGSTESGFLNFAVTDDALLKLSERACLLPAVPLPQVFETGVNVPFIRARLYDAAYTSRVSDGFICKDERLALWHVLMADTDGSRAKTLAELSALLDKHRLMRAMPFRGGVIGKKSAPVMAHTLGAWQKTPS